jgi:uncharacterized membrane protein YhaH (DUF805 family)
MEVIFLIIFFLPFITATWRRLFFYCLGGFLVPILVIFLPGMSLFSIRGFFLTMTIFLTIRGFFLTIFPIIFLIIFFLPFITVTWRRLHDMNRSGWWSVLIYIVHCSFVLVINVSSDMPGEMPGNGFWIPDQVITVLFVLWVFSQPAWFLWMTIKKGTPGPNRFGEDPLQQDNNTPITAHISE